ncbi:MAG TPA: methyltransferase domain-containing protein [Candidatus Latescibacteria bacterium]|nr:methyltransferase domain-containing protein [Candidatus Latescibacterota bacterium]
MSDEVAPYSVRANAEFQSHGRMDVKPSETEITIISDKDRYRQAAKKITASADSVLEIGCSSGATTRILARTGARVVAVDKTLEFIAGLQEELRKYDNVTVECVDGRNIPRLAELMPSPTVILIDIGGDANLDTVAFQLRLCLRAFKPQAVVVRSFELATLASLIGEVEAPAVSGIDSSEHPMGQDPLTNLLDLSRSTSTDTRCFAARRLGLLGTKPARDRLREMADDPHPRVRRAAERTGE